MSLKKYCILFTLLPLFNTLVFLSLSIETNAQESLKICLKNRPSYFYHPPSSIKTGDSGSKIDTERTDEERLKEPDWIYEPDIQKENLEKDISYLPLLPDLGEGRLLSDLQICILIREKGSIRIVGYTSVHNYQMENTEFFVDSSGEAKFAAIFLLSNDYVTVEDFDKVNESDLKKTSNFDLRAVPLISEKHDGKIYLTFPAIQRDFPEYRQLHSAMHVFYCLTEYQKSGIIRPYVINCPKPTAKDVLCTSEIGRYAAYDPKENRFEYGSNDEMSGLDNIYKHEMGHYLWHKSFQHSYEEGKDYSYTIYEPATEDIAIDEGFAFFLSTRGPFHPIFENDSFISIPFLSKNVVNITKEILEKPVDFLGFLPKLEEGSGESVIGNISIALMQIDPTKSTEKSNFKNLL